MEKRYKSDLINDSKSDFALLREPIRPIQVPLEQGSEPPACSGAAVLWMNSPISRNVSRDV